MNYKITAAGLKKAGYIFITVFVIIIIFYLFDKYFHSLGVEYSVPQRYFRNKIIFGTVIGFITALFVQKKKLIWKSVMFSGVVSVLLQVRYLLEGYPLGFVLLFLFIHFVILLVVSLLLFFLLDKIIKNIK